MITMGQGGQLDGEFMAEGMAEVSGLVEEQVTIKRFTGLTGGDQIRGIAPTETYNTFTTLALIEPVSAQELMAVTIYAVGDLKAQFKIEVFGAESNTPGPGARGQRSDRVIVQGREYRIIGHPSRIHYGGIYYWNATLRQGTA